MHWDRQPCASFGQYGLLVVEVVRTWAYPSIGKEQISISKLNSTLRSAVTYLLVFLVLVVAALTSSSEPRLLISLLETINISPKPEIKQSLPSCPRRCQSAYIGKYEEGLYQRETQLVVSMKFGC
jgi:hypothetical protein